MSKIRIKNFGPIKEGYQENDGWLDIKKVTVFIGNQGSGKSTVAKLISTLSWIEKAMRQGVMRQDELNTYNRFLKQLDYQRLSHYIQNDTQIEFEGKAFGFTFEHGTFTTKKAAENRYLLPKIMYVPAERNFLSVVDRPDKLKNLPSPLFTFLDEYDRARNLFAKGIDLPINRARFEYDSFNKLAHIIGPENSYRLGLSEASSGFQSTVPLFLVTKYLAESLTREEDPSISSSSIEEQRRVEREVKRIMADSELTPEVRQTYLRNLSAISRPKCFINIVEEPEQNLFPTSQKKVLYELLKYAKHSNGNELIITTHSPYIINYLTLAVKANSLMERVINNDRLFNKLNNIVPQHSTIHPNDLIVYELNEEEGTIQVLESYKGLPSDENYLNFELGKTNELFAQLLEIQQEL